MVIIQEGDAHRSCCNISGVMRRKPGYFAQVRSILHYSGCYRVQLVIGVSLAPSAPPATVVAKFVSTVSTGFSFHSIDPFFDMPSRS